MGGVRNRIRPVARKGFNRPLYAAARLQVNVATPAITATSVGQATASVSSHAGRKCLLVYVAGCIRWLSSIINCRIVVSIHDDASGGSCCRTQAQIGFPNIRRGNRNDLRINNKFVAHIEITISFVCKRVTKRDALSRSNLSSR